MRSLRLLQRLVAIVVVVAGTVVASSSSSSSQECEVGVDGSCLGGSDSNSISIATDADPATTATVTCIDEHEKCDLWMTKGMCTFVCAYVCVYPCSPAVYGVVSFHASSTVCVTILMICFSLMITPVSLALTLSIQ